jgi:hypothetical protein
MQIQEAQMSGLAAVGSLKGSQADVQLFGQGHRYCDFRQDGRWP